MNSEFNDETVYRGRRRRKPRPKLEGGKFIAFLVIFLGLMAYTIYTQFRIDVPAKHFAVITRKTGEDIENTQEIAPDETYKGLQLDVLPEGRYFYNCYKYDWSVYPMIEIPRDKMGVRIRLYGRDLPYGDFLAITGEHKGIVEEVLKPGRYAINAIVIDRDTKEVIGIPRKKSDFVEIIELWEPTVIPAGYKGIVTNLAGPLPEDPNVLLVETGRRGPQKETLNEGTYYMNPYMYRINAIDTRSQRFNLTEGGEMFFPSKDGFPISLGGIIEFRVIPDQAAQTYVTYNDVTNDDNRSSTITDEIIAKVIMPNARSFCRIQGSKSSAREFIGGETRAAFQKSFQESIQNTCRSQGIEILQALITEIKPPEAIAKPLRDREVARQQLKQYTQEILQQEDEAKLATEVATIEQRRELVDAERTVVEEVTKAEEEQGVEVAEATRDKEVAEKKLEAAKDQAEAILAEATAKAAIIGFENEADAAGWKKAVEALGNNGEAFARYTLYQKLAPGYRSIMTNTADSPLMDVFKGFTEPMPQPPVKTVPVKSTSVPAKSDVSE